MPRIDGERGSFLAEAMVVVVLLALIASMTLRLAFSRRVVASRADDEAAGRQRALGVESQMTACLEGTDFGRTTCALPASSGCPPASIDGKAVTVTASGVPPACRLHISVED
jgi:hypothetical protein